MNREQKITSQWETTKRYVVDNVQKEDVDKSIKVLVMQIMEHNEKDVLVFNGAPTGHEIFYLDDLKISLHGRFCVCAGTPNRWPACFVDRKTVYDFVEQFKAAKGDGNA